MIVYEGERTEEGERIADEIASEYEAAGISTNVYYVVETNGRPEGTPDYAEWETVVVSIPD